MLKGMGEPEMALGIMIFVGGLLFAFGIIFVKFSYVSATVNSNDDQLYLVNTLHEAKACFSNNGDHMQPGLITSSSKAGCGLDDVYICVRDIATGESWLDCTRIERPQIKIYATLSSASGIHIGEISAKKK